MFKKITASILLLSGIQLAHADVATDLFKNSFSSGSLNQDSSIVSPQLSNTKLLVNKTIAIVNDKTITLLQLNDEVAKVMASIPPAQRYTISDEQIQKESLQNLIAQSVLLQLAERNNIQISQQEIDNTINDIASRNGISIDNMKASIEASGISFSDYMQKLKEQIMINRIQQQAIAQQIYVSPQEIQKYIAKHKSDFSQEMSPTKEYLLRNITIDIPSDADKKQQLFSMLQKMAIVINNGGLKFEDVAKEYSDAPNAEDGGTINNWLTTNSIPSIYKSRIKSLKKGQSSEPFIADDAIQMVYLEDIKENKPPVTSQVTEYHLYAISINLTETLTANSARNELNRAKIALESGETFEAMAEKYNQNYDYDDGDFGWVSPMEQPPVVSPTVFGQLKKLKLGEISEPFAADDKTWMIVKYTDTRIYDAKKEIEEQKALEAIFAEKAQQVYKTWIASMKDNAYIQILDDNLKTEDFY